jgi:hypothetical protein
VGDFGEDRVVELCTCQKCDGSLTPLPRNNRIFDVRCECCGWQAQVKAATRADIGEVPETLFGAAWRPMEEMIRAGNYPPLFLVQVNDNMTEFRIYFLDSTRQDPGIYKLREPLGPNARRAGWRGFFYDLSAVKERLVRLH